MNQLVIPRNWLRMKLHFSQVDKEILIFIRMTKCSSFDSPEGETGKLRMTGSSRFLTRSSLELPTADRFEMTGEGAAYSSYRRSPRILTCVIALSAYGGDIFSLHKISLPAPQESK